MTLIVDASVLLAIYLEEPASAAARAALAGEALMAPQLVLAELANGVWRAARITPDMASQEMARVPAFFTALVDLKPLAAIALGLALRRDHPAHDCFYVALAMREAAPLITADRRLAERSAGDADIRLIAG